MLTQIPTEEEKKQWSRDFSDYSDNPSRVTTVVSKDIDEAEDFYDNQLKNKYSAYRQHYENFISIMEITNKKNGAAFLKIPYVWQQIQTLIPKTAAAIVQSRPYIRFDIADIDKHAGEKKDILDRVNTFFDYILSQKVKFYSKFSEIIEKCYVYGGAITKEEWKSEVTSVTMQEMFRDVYGNTQGVVSPQKKIEQFVDDYPDMEIINLDDFIYDPTSTKIENMRYCFIKRNYDLEGLNKLRNTGLITEEGFNIAFNSATEVFSAVDSDYGAGNKKIKPIKIYEYWNVSGYRVFYLPDQKVIIGLDENVYDHKELPFTVWKFNNREGELLGTSLVHALLGMQNENDFMRTQRRDNISLVNNRILLVSDDLELSAEKLTSGAGSIIPVEADNIRNSIMELSVSDLGGSIFQESVAIQQDMDNASGVHDPIRGNFQQKGAQTATAYNVIQGNASERIIERVRFLEADGLTRCFKHMISLCRQFITTDREYVNYSEEPFSQERNFVPVEAFQNVFEVIPETTVSDPTVTPEILKQNKLEGLNTLIPLLETGQVNPRGVVEEICKIYELDSGKIMITPVEQANMEQQQQEQMAQQRLLQQMEMERQAIELQQNQLPNISSMGVGDVR